MANSINVADESSGCLVIVLLIVALCYGVNGVIIAGVIFLFYTLIKLAWFIVKSLLFHRHETIVVVKHEPSQSGSGDDSDVVDVDFVVRE